MSVMPAHLVRYESELPADYQLQDAELAIQQWALYWQDNRDHWSSNDYPSMTPFERVLHPTGRDLGELAIMPPLVELVDQVICKLPFDYRRAAWVFWVQFEGGQMEVAWRYCKRDGVALNSKAGMYKLVDGIRVAVVAALA